MESSILKYKKHRKDLYKSLQEKTSVLNTNKMKSIVFPLRIGRKQKRAVLDSNGLEVVVFPVGMEHMSELMCKLYNDFYKDLENAWEKFDK